MTQQPPTPLDPEERKKRLHRAMQLHHSLSYPWQQGMYVSHRTSAPAIVPDHVDAHLEAHLHDRERRTVRGPGVIGSPECNVVMETTREEDAAIVVRLRYALADLLAELALEQHEHREFLQTLGQGAQITSHIHKSDLLYAKSDGYRRGFVEGLYCDPDPHGDISDDDQAAMNDPYIPNIPTPSR